MYGQAGSFSTSGGNTGGISANSLLNPRYLSLDNQRGLYVGDGGNSRVLYYPAGTTTATRVYGQFGSFITGTGNNGGVSANSLNDPFHALADGQGGVYVSDFNNNRVLHYPVDSTTADRVYGQAGSFTTTACNKGGISADSLCQPYHTALDQQGGLYVVDEGNFRILYYPAGSTTANRVYGQSGDFATGTQNKGGVSANSLNDVTFCSLDSEGGLYVADYPYRLLHFPAGITTADRVYGQGGTFTTNPLFTACAVTPSANSVCQPFGVSFDSFNGGLYVADTGNARVLHYPANSTTADKVYGQADFTGRDFSFSDNTAFNLYGVRSVLADGLGGFYTAQYDKHRLMHYPPGK